MALAETRGVVRMVIVLVTVMIKMNFGPSFSSGPLQNLSPPRRPSHPHAPKTVPPAGRPGAAGVPGPHLHHPGIRPAAQGPQWEGNSWSAPLPQNSRLGYKWAVGSEHNSAQRAHSKPGKPEKHKQH